MWELWRKRGGSEEGIVRITQSGLSTMIEFEFRL